jgi:hypothetical protein
MRGARFTASIASGVRDALRDMPEIADNGVELDALAALPAEQQAAAVAAVKSGRAPSVRDAITTTAQPTLCAADNADSPLDAMLEQIRRLGEGDRERLWEAVADQWHKEISRALTCRLRQCPRPGANEMSAYATPSHPAVGGPVQPSCVPFCGRIYAVNSVEWAEEQRRLGNSG